MKPEKQHVVQVTPQDWDALRQSKPSDYDGHTAFDRMTPAARLEWLDAAVQFVSEAKRAARPAPQIKT
jgi:hypothetical protein